MCRYWEELCALSVRFPDPSPVLDKNRAPKGPEILSSTGAGVWKKAPKAFPDSSSVLDKFQSATKIRVFQVLGERQSIAQKGVRAIDARNSQLENG